MSLAIRNFKPDDYNNLRAWLSERNIKNWEEKYIPRVGFVVTKEENLIAMAFLRMIEGGSAMIDGLCTNPAISGQIRNEAIDMVVTKILQFAKQEKINSILSYSKDEHTIERGLKFGFKKNTEQVVLTLKLED